MTKTPSKSEKTSTQPPNQKALHKCARSNRDALKASLLHYQNQLVTIHEKIQQLEQQLRHTPPPIPTSSPLNPRRLSFSGHSEANPSSKTNQSKANESKANESCAVAIDNLSHFQYENEELPE
jgi:hypothetical protein